MYQIVGDNGLLRKIDFDSNRTEIVGAAMMNVVVGDAVTFVFTFPRSRIEGNLRAFSIPHRARSDSASSQIMDIISFDGDVGGAIEHGKPHAADVRYPAITETAGARMFKTHRRIDPD